MEDGRVHFRNSGMKRLLNSIQQPGELCVLLWVEIFLVQNQLLGICRRTYSWPNQFTAFAAELIIYMHGKITLQQLPQNLCMAKSDCNICLRTYAWPNQIAAFAIELTHDLIRLQHSPHNLRMSKSDCSICCRTYAWPNQIAQAQAFDVYRHSF